MTWFNFLKRTSPEFLWVDNVMEDGEYRSVAEVIEELYKLKESTKQRVHARRTGNVRSFKNLPTTGALHHYLNKNPKYEKALFDKRTDKMVYPTPKHHWGNRKIKYRMVI